MKPQYHVAVSLAISSILHLVFKSWGLTLTSFFSGIIIDLDYLIDYLKFCGFPFTIDRFKWFYYQKQLTKIRLFHGWEWLLLLVFVAWLYDWNVWVVGIVIGFCQHLVLDNLYRRERFMKYSLLWRLRKGY